MKAPKIPSFFKSSSSKLFSFNPRYYNEKKRRSEQWEKGTKVNIKFNREHAKIKQKGRSMKIVFLIIILSLLAYKFIIN